MDKITFFYLFGDLVQTDLADDLSDDTLYFLVLIVFCVDFVIITLDELVIL